MRVVVWWQAQALFQRTALQPVHRHDYVQFIHGCVMTRASSRRSRVVYGKLFWADQASQPLLLDKVASAATVVRPDAPPCLQVLGPAWSLRPSSDEFPNCLFAFGRSRLVRRTRRGTAERSVPPAP